MVFRGEIGNVTQKQISYKYFKWTVANFLTFIRDCDIDILSPTFQFESYQCAIGLQIFENEEWIRIHCLISPKNYVVHVKLGVLASDGEEYKNFSVHYRDDNPIVHLYEQQYFLQKSELNRVLHSGQLIVFCEIQQEDSEKEIIQTDAFDGILAA